MKPNPGSTSWAYPGEALGLRPLGLLKGLQKRKKKERERRERRKKKRKRKEGGQKEKR